MNIVLFHSFMAPEGLPMALFATVLWLIVFIGVRKAFARVFAQRVEV
jgi:putative oxidoreductase